ncbi:CDP-glycerol glycerophosphotransferase (TagB/SpsB family) [Planomicrobium soli]|uniref:CDP-glycerol glycerophosphotransferase (TagB/SpsB family) n=1 Tax=Planomicrobium soli TaxID=1176648 RepID=A0A2P8H3A4_9BACL|nr:CDP-glycerol glycerophosphotransferase family protein [Planomicrobium soli]PSL40699.1 CDP-glycerol glycerophosphotransferase (TagB/SpsB family) [Planomicrobium soli]
MTLREKYFSLEAIKGIFYFFYKAIPMLLLSYIILSKNKNTNIWLISERPSEARDNGFHLFKYIRKNYSEVDCYYIIKRSSSDVKKVAPLKNIVFFGTFKHYLYYFLAIRHISTHGAGYGSMPNKYACSLVELVRKSKAKKVYLKHGIIKDFLPGLTKKKANFDLFVCGALPEYEYVKSNFGYQKDEVKYIGLARFDELIENKQSKNQIMYMPTWRRWLDNTTEETFKASEYFYHIKSLLESSNLNTYLEDNKLTFILCLHPKFLKYKNTFIGLNKNIIVASTKKHDIQELLKSSSVLITDYSSVYFDFAYMNKPLIYFQFDYERYRKQHYTAGYFNYHNNGFGPVVKNEEHLINELTNMAEKNFKISSIYRKRIEEFFPIIDKKNCERNFRSILNL